MSLISHRSRRRIGAGVVAAVIALPAVALTVSPAFADGSPTDTEYCEQWEVSEVTDLETGEVETTRVCEAGAVKESAHYELSPDGCVIGGWDFSWDPAIEGEVRYELTPDTECLAAHGHQEVPDGEREQEWGHATGEPGDVVAVDEGQDAPAANVADEESTDPVAIEH